MHRWHGLWLKTKPVQGMVICSPYTPRVIRWVSGLYSKQTFFFCAISLFYFRNMRALTGYQIMRRISMVIKQMYSHFTMAMIGRLHSCLEEHIINLAY